MISVRVCALIRKGTASSDCATNVPSPCLVTTSPSVLVVTPRLPFEDLKTFMDYAKAHPNAINAASAGLGSSPHFAIELLRTTTGTHLTHVPYRGSSPVTADLLGGQVDVYFDNLPPALPNIKSGKLRALAVASEKRAPYANRSQSVVILSADLALAMASCQIYG